MTENFINLIAFILPSEGSYVNNPADPGGATKYGITQRRLDLARKEHPELALPADVANLIVDHADEIYWTYEWVAIRGAELPAAFALVLLDTEINQGTAIKQLQTALRVTVDGVFGEITLAALRAAHAPFLINEICALRMRAYMGMTSLIPEFGLGWARRLMRLHASAVTRCAQ